MKITRTDKNTGKTETIFEGKIDKVVVDKSDKKDKTKEVDTKVFADVLLLTMLEIMGVEKFRVALSMALNRHASDSHLKTERKQASEFNNVISDLKYLGWQTDDFKM